MQQQREVKLDNWWLAGVLGGLVCAGLFWSQVTHAELGGNAPFPVPETLRPNIAFWKRIFGVLDTRSGVLHDMHDLTIIYHTFHDLPESSQERQDTVDSYREYYRHILDTLAQGKRVDLDSDEKRVFALFKGKPLPAALWTAADNMRFQLGIRDRFADGLMRSVDYLSVMEPIFVDAGLPRELMLLPHVESSFNHKAYSKAGAAGMWQFTAGTGRRYMRIDSRVDERYDIRLSTIAATKLLRDNYDMLGTWPLAITAYNHGPYGMRQAVETVGTTDFGAIVERYRGPLFGFASKNFYAEFLAAVEIVRQHKQYFPELAFARSPYPAPAPYVRMAESSEPRREFPAVPSAFGEALQRREYRVQSGDTLWSIAQHFDTTPSALAALNSLPAHDEVRSGQMLTLPPMWQQDVAKASMRPRETMPPSVRPPSPAPVRAPAPRVVASASVSASPAVQPIAPAPRAVPSAPVSAPAPQRVAVTKTYQVQPGETLTGIARRFDTTSAALADLNGLKPPLMVRSGQVLTLPAAASQQIVAKPAPQKAIPEPERRPAASQPNVVPAVRRVVAKTYRVRAGDTLTEIARRFATTVPTLLALNGLKKPVIKPGQILTLPPTAAPGTVAEGPVPPDTVRATPPLPRVAMAR